ncbi:hypothetical protein ANCDUO_08929 [Ancylostoma duodenale]|uniref:Uncharacterized protein n=1 Tax=Ancylostoma duodenale TaxID=51022 RepID=A0A0C2CV67_9BILA|nr:hypothetical protein ANCDUO_08929 [Ancylostoma duodenale]
MEKGPVSLNLVARVKAHPMYDSRPMVKELLESIMAAQPEKIQRETSKLVQQQSQVSFTYFGPLLTTPKAPTPF